VAWAGGLQGLVHESFADILKGLSGAKIISHGSFKSHNKGYSVRTSLKAEEGYLYPLEKAFFFLPKPPTLIPYEEVRALRPSLCCAGLQAISCTYTTLATAPIAYHPHEIPLVVALCVQITAVLSTRALSLSLKRTLNPKACACAVCVPRLSTWPLSGTGRGRARCPAPTLTLW